MTFNFASLFWHGPTTARDQIQKRSQQKSLFQIAVENARENEKVEKSFKKGFSTPGMFLVSSITLSDV